MQPQRFFRYIGFTGHQDPRISCPCMIKSERVFFLVFAAIIVVLAFAPARFRNIGLGIMGALLLVFLVTVIVDRPAAPPPPPPAVPRQSDVSAESRKFDFDKYERDQKDKEDPDAKTRIAVSEVRFDQVQSIPGIEAGTIRTVHARIYNDSHKFTLTDYWYYLVIQDCLAEQRTQNAAARCTTVFDQRESVPLSVPPDQARDIVIAIPKDSANAAPFKLSGSPRIELTATDVRAYR